MHDADENSEHKQTFSVAHGVADAVLESLMQKLAARGMAYRYVFNHGRGVCEESLEVEHSWGGHQIALHVGTLMAQKARRVWTPLSL